MFCCPSYSQKEEEGRWRNKIKRYTDVRYSLQPYVPTTHNSSKKKKMKIISYIIFYPHFERSERE